MQPADARKRTARRAVPTTLNVLRPFDQLSNVNRRTSPSLPQRPPVLRICRRPVPIGIRQSGGRHFWMYFVPENPDFINEIANLDVKTGTWTNRIRHVAGVRLKKPNIDRGFINVTGRKCSKSPMISGFLAIFGQCKTTFVTGQMAPKLLRSNDVTSRPFWQ